MKKEDVLAKVREISRNKKLKKTMETGRRALDIAYKIKHADLSGPLSVFGTVLGATDLISGLVSSFDDGEMVVAAESSLSALLKMGYRTAGEYDDDNTMYNILCQMHSAGIFSRNAGENKIKIKDDEFIFTHINEKKIICPNESGRINRFFFEDGLTKEELSDYFWEHMVTGHAIALDIDYGGNLTIARIDAYYENEYIGDKDPILFVKRHKKYLEHGANRSFLFTGPPGTGKTTFSFKIAKEMDGRVLVITPDVLSRLDGHMDIVVSCVKGTSPKVIVFEDVDRASHSESLLSLIDQMRKVANEAMIISTANHPERITAALKRPGRLGSAIEFGRPKDQEAVDVIKLYSTTLGLDRDITHMVKYMDHDLFTHDYIRDVCAYALVAQDEELKEYIEFCKKNFEKIY